MKKLCFFLIAAAWCNLVPVSFANAAVWYTEEYNGEQFIGAGESFDFHFDLWFSTPLPGTNSVLILTQDAVSGGDVQFDQASIYTTLYSVDPEFEYANVKFVALSNNQELFSDSFVFSKSGEDNLYYYTYTLNDFQLDVFNDFGGSGGGWGDVTISALVTASVVNDYQINNVGMVAAVPEPATLILLGAGMIGLAAIRRRLSIR